MIKAVELYCGIGGFSKASEHLNISVQLAYDQNDAAIETYNKNFSHHAQKFNIEKFDAKHLESLHVDFLWMSPPCQPYTKKGVQKDLNDFRSDSFKTVLEALSTCKNPPLHVGLENVEGFKDSQARDLLVTTLKKVGYNISEILLCPSELGIPNRRMRYYLCASLKLLKPLIKSSTCKALKQFLNEPDEPTLIPKEILEKFQNGFRIIKREGTNAYSTCFTSSYSKSWMHSGAYLECKDGVRLFEPNEISSLMGFGENFIFPQNLSKRQCYKLIGNSLSVFALKDILSQFDLNND
jgi:DNA (cytosine-5)-methyltransferase 1